MATSLQPANGVRILLELEAVDPAGGARYRGAVLTALTRTDFAVTLDDAGLVSATPMGEEQADGAGDRGREILRSIARTVGKHALAESPAAWPRRVLRWRRV